MLADTPRLSTEPPPPPPRTRVVVMEDDGATQAFNPRPERVHALLRAAVTNFTRHTDIAAAWRTLVTTQDVIGIKVFSSPGSQIGTRPAVVDGLVKSLLEAKISPGNIVIWDRRLPDLRLSGFDEVARRHGVRLAGSIESGWDEQTFYESSLLGQLVYGDFEFQKQDEGIGRKSFVTKLLTKELTRIINVSPLLNHNAAGVCGSLYSLSFGSVDNWIRFERDPAKLAVAVPEIYALPAIGDRVAIHVVDALLCQYQGEQIGRLHYSVALNQVWLGTDPIALDILALEELDRQRKRSVPTAPSQTNRLHLYRNAELLELGIADRRRIDVEISRPGRAAVLQ